MHIRHMVLAFVLMLVIGQDSVSLEEYVPDHWLTLAEVTPRAADIAACRESLVRAFARSGGSITETELVAAADGCARYAEVHNTEMEDAADYYNGAQPRPEFTDFWEARDYFRSHGLRVPPLLPRADR